MISNLSPLVWLGRKTPAISLDRARLRGAELSWHLQRRSLGTVLVCQRISAPDPGASPTVEATDPVPADWQLEELAVRRFGPTLCRISRLVAVSAPAGQPQPMRGLGQ